MKIEELKARISAKNKNIIYVARHYGKASQLRMLAEECAELGKEALKAIRCKGANKESLIEEIADVEVMVEQIRYLFEISFEDTLTVKEQKLIRQIKRIEEAKND
jgi:NTP pyrophosphatase (non-canonical NTP hydrolase)